MKKALTIISSIIGAIICTVGSIMPFDSDLIFYAPPVTFVGALLLFLPQIIIWRKNEHGAYVTAAVIIALSVVLVATVLPAYGYAQSMYF